MLRGTWKRLAFKIFILTLLAGANVAMATPTVPNDSVSSPGLRMARRMVSQLKLRPSLSRAHQQAAHLVRRRLAKQQTRPTPNQASKY